MTKLLYTLILFTSIVYAGGDHEAAKIKQFARYNETDYILVLSPVDKPLFESIPSSISKCELITVVGKFSSKGFFESGFLPSRENHVKAVNYLSSSTQVINFGYMGGGLKQIDSNNLCVLESRALLFEYSAVLSFHDGV